MRPGPEDLLPDGNGGVAFAPQAREGRLVREPGLVGGSGALAEREKLPRNRVDVARERTVAVNRIDVEIVLGVFQEMFVYPGAALPVHARNVPRGGPAVRYHADVGASFLQPVVCLALHGHRLVVRAAEAKVPLVADLVVVDPRAVPRGEPFAESAEGPGNGRPHGVRRQGGVGRRRSHRPPRRLEDYRVERKSIVLEFLQKLVRSRELPAVRTRWLDARHIREVRAREFSAAGDHGGRGEAAVAVSVPREMPVDAEAESPARLLRRDAVVVHDGEARIDRRNAAVVRGKFAADSPHAFGIAHLHRNPDCLASAECNVHRQIEHFAAEPFQFQSSACGDFFLRGVVYCKNGLFVLPLPNDMQRISRLRLDAQRLGLRRLEHAAQRRESDFPGCAVFLLAPDGERSDLVFLRGIQPRLELSLAGNRRGELDRLSALLCRKFENRQFRSRLVLHVRLHAEDDFFRASKRLHARVTVILNGKVRAPRGNHLKT